MTRTARLESLDVFRGLTVAGMLLVNNPGSWSHVYAPLEHAEWHGWTPTDLIFPFFLFIVGVSMAFSFGKQREAGVGRGELFSRAAKRALILFGLGLVLAGFPTYDLATLRIPGVLQRIALVFIVASAAVLTLGARGVAILSAVLLMGYWALMTRVPVPGFGAGNLTPEGNLGAYLDRQVIGTAHLWRQSRTWDPEGLLSTLPAIATTLLGVLTGYWIRSAREAQAKALGMLGAGAAGIVLGLLWNQAFPINKNMWTSSYVVFTAGMALWFLALCYWVVDVRGFRQWARPFVWFGVNAIAAFFLSGLMARILGLLKLQQPIYETGFASWAGPLNGSLAYAVAFVLFWTGIMAVLYRRKIFIKV